MNTDFNTSDIRKAIENQDTSEKAINQVIAFLWEFDTYGFIEQWGCIDELTPEKLEEVRQEAIYRITDIKDVLLDEIEYYEMNMNYLRSIKE